MNVYTVFVICGTIIGTTSARILPIEEDQDVNYNFKYGVEDHTTGDIKSHQEIRNGKEVTGVYTLREADGTTRIVKYTASPEKGFNAVVEKVGQVLPSSTGASVKSFGDFSSKGFNFHGFSGFQAGASEQVPVIAGSTPQYDFQSVKV